MAKHLVSLIARTSDPDHGDARGGRLPVEGPDGDLGVALVQQVASAMRDDPQLTRWKRLIEDLQEIDDGDEEVNVEELSKAGKPCMCV